MSSQQTRQVHAHHRPSCPNSSPLRQRAVSQHRHAGTTWIRSVRLHTIYAVEEVFAVVSGVRCALVGHCCELGFDSCQPQHRASLISAAGQVQQAMTEGNRASCVFPPGVRFSLEFEGRSSPTPKGRQRNPFTCRHHPHVLESLKDGSAVLGF